MVKYMYCSKCKLVRKGVESGRNELICTECGNRLRIKNMAPRICADCDSHLYAPDEMLDALVFPCKAEHRAQVMKQAEERTKAEKIEGQFWAQPSNEADAERLAAEAEALEIRRAAEAAAARLAADKAANPDLKCPNCQATLRYIDGRYENCPLCSFVPDEKWVTAEQYLNKKGHAPIVIRHEFGSDEFVFVHPTGRHMPAGSGIVVEQNQVAAYRAAGQYIYLAEPRLYPVSLDDRTEAERLMAIAKGEQGEIMLKMDTKIIFFDQRWKLVKMKPAIRLIGSDWTVIPQVEFLMQITDVSQLLTVAIDMSDDAALAAYLEHVVGNVVEDVLYSEVNAAFGDTEALTGMDRNALELSLYRRMDDEVVREITRLINRKLANCGAAVDQLKLDIRRADYIKV
ncbi:MAG: hypothetical protein IJ041_07430 [Clostridia bacterium]|nr:hypothetical protein [Clostridia bacterium]